jgi:hypothetical protein
MEPTFMDFVRIYLIWWGFLIIFGFTMKLFDKDWSWKGESMNETKLFPELCPFCGVKPEVINNFGMKAIEHPTNGCPLGRNVMRLEEWNKRVRPKDVQSLGEMDEGKRKAVLEWATAFYDNIKDAEKDVTAPKEILLACGSLKIIISAFGAKEGKRIKFPEKYKNANGKPLGTYDQPGQVNSFYNGKMHGFNEAIDLCKKALEEAAPREVSEEELTKIVDDVFMEYDLKCGKPSGVIDPIRKIVKAIRERLQK